MENTTLTAEEFYQQAINDKTIGDDITDLMNAYAKMHVEAALKEASSQAYWDGSDGVNIKSILNSYPLTNIK